MATSSEKSEKMKVLCKKWREKNKDKIKEYQEKKNQKEKEYYQRNREKIIAKKLEYYYKKRDKNQSPDKPKQKHTSCAKDKKTNICADCGYPIKDCPWLHKGKEVPGWDAKRVQWSTHEGVFTYSIVDCPLFIPCKKKCTEQELQ